MIGRTIGLAGVSAVVALVAAGAALAAQKPVTVGEAISETFTIEAINYADRIVTLKDKDGFSEDVVAGPEVKRFDALKVGDRVTFRYYESLVTALRRPDATKKAPETVSVNRTPGTKPGGTVSQQMTTVVTLEAIDAKVPSVTIKTTDGRRMSFKVENSKNLAGYKAGDNVEITYTRALAVNVEPAK
jgi:Cu/Ag efflux protein CusF